MTITVTQLLPKVTLAQVLTDELASTMEEELNAKLAADGSSATITAVKSATNNARRRLQAAGVQVVYTIVIKVPFGKNADDFKDAATSTISALVKAIDFLKKLFSAGLTADGLLAVGDLDAYAAGVAAKTTVEAEDDSVDGASPTPSPAAETSPEPQAPTYGGSYGGLKRSRKPKRF